MRVVENEDLNFVRGGWVSYVSQNYGEGLNDVDFGGGSASELIIGDFKIRDTSNICTPTYTILPDVVITASRINPIGQEKAEKLVGCFQNLTMPPGKATKACANSIKGMMEP